MTCRKLPNCGFTMIEMIGVLAIMAILLSIIAPNIARQVTRATADAEDEELSRLSVALVDYVRQNRIIPGETAGAAGGWDGALAPMLAVPANRVVENTRAGTRRLILDPAAVGIAALPWTQSAAFAAGAGVSGLPTSVQNVRLLWVSNLDGAAPAAALTAAEFTAAWDQVAPPAGFIADDNTRIGRTNLQMEFQPVVVNLNVAAVLGGASGTSVAWSLLGGGVMTGQGSCTAGPQYNRCIDWAQGCNCSSCNLDYRCVMAGCDVAGLTVPQQNACIAAAAASSSSAGTSSAAASSSSAAAATYEPYLAVDGSAAKAMGTATTVLPTFYVLKGTVLALSRTPISGGTTELQARLIVGGPTTLRFDGTTWSW